MAILLTPFVDRVDYDARDEVLAVSCVDTAHEISNGIVQELV